METNDPVLQEDLNGIVDKIKNFDGLKNSTILVTGATGLIGSLLVKSLLCLNREKNASITILALVRDKEKAYAVFGDLLDRENIKLIVHDIIDEIMIEEDVNYIIHCASITTSKFMIEKPVETIITSVYGTKNILDLASKKRVKSFVYISSMEMYGSFFNFNNEVTEHDLGFIDPLKIRSNYPESKRLCENLCVSYFTEYNVPIKIARLAQTFGAGILPGENRIFAQFAKSVINNENIVLHTTGESEGNYVYTRDAMIAIFILLTTGANGEAYNVSNEESHISIVNMANMVATELAEDKIKVVFNIPKSNTYGYAEPTKMKLSSAKLRLLGWNSEVSLKESYERLIESIRYTIKR